MTNTKLHAVSALFLAAILVLSCGHDRGRRAPIGFEDEARDTISIHVPELSGTPPEYVRVLRVGDYYYFEIEPSLNASPSFWKAVAINGFREKDLPTPGENFSIYKRRDSLIASSYREGKVLVFDPKTWTWKDTWKDTWKETRSSDIDPLHSLYLYEDDDWVIRGTDHGEFGSASWFIDKQSGAEYAFLTLSGKVHRTDSCFFFVKETRIIGIPDPSMGFLCDSTTCYEKAKDVGLIAHHLLQADYLERRKAFFPPLVKFDDAYSDEIKYDGNYRWINSYGIDPYAESDTLIINSFTDRDTLYCLLDTPQHTVLTKLDGNHLADVHAFPKRLDFRGSIPILNELDYPIASGDLLFGRNDDGSYELLQLGSNYSRLIHVQFR